MHLFFASSRDFESALTRLYDFVNPAAAALWNMRKEVPPFVLQEPRPTLREEQQRFLAGSGIGSANLRRAFTEWTWEEHQEQLAGLALFQAVGLFEGWTEAVEVSLTPVLQ